MKKSFITRLLAIVCVILLSVPSLVILVGSEFESELDDQLPTGTDPAGTVSSTEGTASSTEATEPLHTEPALNDIPMLYTSLIYTPVDSIDETKELQNLVFDAMYVLMDEIASGKYTKVACDRMSEDITRLSEIVTAYDADIEEFQLWESRYEEYPYATKLWRYLKDNGYSDTVCAGIMGNFMTETGGHTLALRPHIYDSTGIYYGLAQWSGGYHAEVRGKSFDYQCEYLIKTIPQEFNKFGYMYETNFTFDDFMCMTSTKEAAMAFAKCYERCTPVSYSKRQVNSTIAYEYFTKGEF
jgi:hypothetical protein